MERFFLGCHQPSWLRKTDVPLFISRRRLEKRKKLPQARGPWSLDSGGFSELSLYGEWTITVKQYVEEVRRCFECIGKMQWAASCDMMVEPHILQKTGLTVEKHQALTIDNFLEAKSLAPDLPIIPILQGWTWGDFLYHLTAYRKRGVDLRKEPVVGVGSVCRRSGTLRAGTIAATLRHELGDRLHFFGWKIRALALNQEHVRSTDSLAWSYNARRKPALPECEGLHPSCQNCLTFALKWRQKVLSLLNMKDPPRERELRQRLLF